jgi:hypothetical protein
MLPAHYALSEILIVLVSVYTLTVFFKARQFYIFAGVFLISCAALIASIRFGINYQNELKSFHQLLSAISLLFGIPLIVIEIMKRSNLLNNKIIYLVLLIAIIFSLFILLQAKNLIILVAASWLIIGAIFSILISRERALMRIVSGIFFSLIIINLILRRMELFDASTSWHLYHIGIAVWLYLITRILKQNEAKYV